MVSYYNSLPQRKTNYFIYKEPSSLWMTGNSFRYLEIQRD